MDNLWVLSTANVMHLEQLQLWEAEHKTKQHAASQALDHESKISKHKSTAQSQTYKSLLYYDNTQQ